MGSLPAASLRGAMGLLLRTMVLAALLGLDAAGKDLSKQPSFVYPEPDSSYVFNKMDTVMVRYISYRETAELWTFCEPGSNPRLSQLARPSPPPPPRPTPLCTRR